jgi:hypothetical protein
MNDVFAAQAVRLFPRLQGAECRLSTFLGIEEQDERGEFIRRPVRGALKDM